MTRQRYDIKEALNRILRILYGSPDPNEQRDTIAGEVLSENQAISDLAELLAGSLPNQNPSIPSTISITGTAGRNDEYGGIFVSGSTSGWNLASGSWTQLTPFNMDMESSGGIVPQHGSDNVQINAAGTYFVGFSLSFQGAQDTVYELAAHLAGTLQPQVMARVNVTGSNSVSAFGFVDASTPGAIDVRVLPDTTGTFTIPYGQLTVQKVW